MCCYLSNEADSDVYRSWFKLKDTFRTDQLLVRNDYGTPLRTIYLSNPIIKVSRLQLLHGKNELLI